MFFAGIQDVSHTEFFIIMLVFTSPYTTPLLIIYCCYLLFLQTTLTVVKPQHRCLRPYLVWLLLVPGFSLAWYPYVIFKIAASLENEVRARGMDATYFYGWWLGVGFIALSVLTPLMIGALYLCGMMKCQDAVLTTASVMILLYGLTALIHCALVGVTRSEL